MCTYSDMIKYRPTRVYALYLISPLISLDDWACFLLTLLSEPLDSQILLRGLHSFLDHILKFYVKNAEACTPQKLILMNVILCCIFCQGWDWPDAKLAKMRRNLLQLWHLHGCSWIVKTPTPQGGKHFLSWFTLISEMTKSGSELAKIS